MRELDYGLVRDSLLYAVQTENYEALNHLESILFELIIKVRSLILNDTIVRVVDYQNLDKAIKLLLLIIEVTN